MEYVEEVDDLVELRARARRPNFVKLDRYRENDPDPLLRRNPMALVFPPPESDSAVYKALAVSPQPKPQGFWEWPLEQRKEYLDFIDEFHYVFQNEIDLVHKAIALVRKSYRNRDPGNPRVLNAILRIIAGQEVKTPRLSKAGAGGGLGLLITGITGLGKSSLLDRLVEYLGDYGRFHQTLAGEPAQWPQLGVIRVNAQRTWKATLQRILADIDRQLGRDFYLKRERASSTAKLEKAVHDALTAGFAPLLIIDELQRLARLNETKALEILEGLIDMMGEWGIPVIVVGTVRVRRLMDRYSAEMDKFSNGGIPEFLPLDELDPDTANFILLLKEHSVSLAPVRYSEDFDRLLVAHCMGVRRIMREYMKVVLTRHADDERIDANGALLEDISKDELKRFEKALSVLRKVKLGMRLTFADLQAYEDYLPPETNKKRKQTGAQVRVEAAWRHANETSLADDDSPGLSAKEYLSLAQTLAEEEAADLARADAGEMAQYESRVQAVGDEPAKVTPKQNRTRMQTASDNVKKVSKVVAIGAMKPAKEQALNALDPGKVS